MESSAPCTLDCRCARVANRLVTDGHGSRMLYLSVKWIEDWQLEEPNSRDPHLSVTHPWRVVCRRRRLHVQTAFHAIAIKFVNDSHWNASWAEHQLSAARLSCRLSSAVKWASTPCNSRPVRLSRFLKSVATQTRDIVLVRRSFWQSLTRRVRFTMMNDTSVVKRSRWE